MSKKSNFHPCLLTGYQLNNALNDLNKSKDKAALDSLNSQLDKALNDLNH